MPLADDMMNLRREIEGLHAARKAMMHRLNRFRMHLKKDMARSMAELRRAFNHECARARTARHAFSAHNQEMASHMLEAFGAERASAHRNFRGKRV